MAPRSAGLGALLALAMSCSPTASLAPDRASLADLATQDVPGTADRRQDAAPDLTDAPSPPRQGPPAWIQGGVIYEIFLRSWADSDGDGVGDIQGVISHLDYLSDNSPQATNDLGVRALWLLPPFPSPSYHGYDVTDYGAINPDYGTREDLQELVAQASARGMRIILDLPLNHSSSQHPWFQEASSGPSAAKRDWYIWSAQDPGWTQPWSSQPAWHPLGGEYYYGVFSASLPDLNLANPAVLQEMITSAQAWLALGVAGFRIDAARYLREDEAGQADIPATHDTAGAFRQALVEAHPEALLIAEAWTDLDRVAAYWGAGREYDLAFDFDLSAAIQSALIRGEARPIAEHLNRLINALEDLRFEGPFLTNHDMTRLPTAVGASEAQLRAVATLILTLPGVPVVYYGEEIGMPNGLLSQDEQKRLPMRWDSTETGGFTSGTPWAPLAGSVNVADQSGREGSLLNHYRRMIHLRAATAALAKGDMLPLASCHEGLLAYARRDGAQTAVVAINLAEEGLTCSLDLTPLGSLGETGTCLVADMPCPAVSSTTLSVEGLPGHGVVVMVRE